jgi:argininosuccinate lyase
LSGEDLAAVDPHLTAGVLSVLSPEASVKSRTSFGGTAPAAVRKRIDAAKKVLGMTS